MHRFHYGVMAAVLLAGTSIGAAQQEKTQQNSADEALTRSAPEAKNPPQAPAAAKQNDASQSGLQQESPAFTDGKLTAPGAPQDAEDDPAKFSKKNAALDDKSILGQPLLITDDQKRAVYQQLSQGPAAASNITAKISEQVPATLALQELPQDIKTSMPGISDYKYLRLSDRILVINPRESVVVGEITN